MACTALSLSSFLPLSSSSSKPRSPRKPSHGNPNRNFKLKSKFPPLPPSYRSAGGDATTYTRLPPKDSAIDAPSLEIRLHDSPPSLESRKGAIFHEEVKEELMGFESDDDDDDDEDGVLSSSFGSESEEEELDLPVEYKGHEDLEEFSEKGEDFKEKGVPAVMRCFDRAKIYVKAGDGGNGVVAFRREKFVPYGGPSGGDGGRGGDVYLEVDGSMNSLLPFRKAVHFRAGRGAHGQGRKQVGAKGEDVVVKVAPGTVVREAMKGGVEGEVLLELVKPGQRALLLPGGRGGRGNASFKTGMNKVPKIAENGEEGAEM